MRRAVVTLALIALAYAAMAAAFLASTAQAAPLQAKAERLGWYPTYLAVTVRLDVKVKRATRRAGVYTDGCLAPSPTQLNACGPTRKHRVKLHKGRNRVKLDLLIRRWEYVYVYPPAGYDWSEAWDAVRYRPGAIDAAAVELRVHGRPVDQVLAVPTNERRLP